MDPSDPSYQAFLEQCSRDCTCCPDCTQDRPCDGTMAGGLCYQVCRCDDECPHCGAQYPDGCQCWETQG